MEITGWVIPICEDKGSSKWTLIPKIYRTKSYAKSGFRERKGGHVGKIALEPVQIKVNVDIPNCDECQERFKCYTERK
jgi:hypothetical protein